MHFQTKIFSIYFLVLLLGCGKSKYLKTDKDELLKVKMSHIIGKWKPQEFDETCWKATLRNLTMPNWVIKKISEDSIDIGNIGPAELNYFELKSKELFSEPQTIKNNYVLKFSAINQYLSYDSPRPLINSFNFKDTIGDESGYGHFINIIGCDTTNQKGSHQKWLEIYDPKPDFIGTKYLKNYESYKVMDSGYERSSSLEATYFHFVGKNIRKKPIRTGNDSTQRIFSDKYVCSDCLEKENIRKPLAKLLMNAVFKPFSGDTAKFKTLYKIPIFEIADYDTDDLNFRSQANSETLVKQLLTLKFKPKSYLIISYNKKGILNGGVTLRLVKGGKLLIDRVENLSKYGDIQRIIENVENPIICETKDMNRFLVFKKNDNANFLDMDNLLNKNNYIYTSKEFSEAFAPSLLKITESGYNIFKDCQRIIDLPDTDVINGGILKSRYILPAEMNLNEYADFETKSKLTYMISKDLVNSDIGFNYITLQFIAKDTLKLELEKVIKSKYWPSNYYGFDNNEKYYNAVQILFIPTSTYPTIVNYDSLETVAKKALTIGNIAKIGTPYLEHPKGYMNSIPKEKKEYNKIGSSKGILCEILLKNGKVELCYVVTKQATDLRDIKWKE